VTLLVLVGPVAADPGPGPRRPPEGKPDVRDGVVRKRDLEYGRVGDTSLRLDLYLPEKAKVSVPLVLWVHGGGWVRGSKSFCPLLKLVPRGYAVASVGYRLATVAPHPAQIDDVRAAVRWLRANAKEHGLDPARVGAVGASAGGHLVALLGTADEPPCPPGSPSCRVQAVVDLFGPSDLVDLVGRLADHGIPTPVDTLLGGPLSKNRDRAVEASPVTHATDDDPPFLILHGDRDWLVPLRQSERLEKALSGAGVEARLHVVRGAGHGFSGPEIEAMVAEFLDRHLKEDASADAGAKPAVEKTTR
jgi:acetyl esterase/lipase